MSIRSAAIIGIEAHPVDIETDISFGIHAFTLVGLPDVSVRESKERIRAALRRVNLPFPRTRITVNLAPANVKKQGPVFDLPIAISLLCASGELPQEAFANTLIIGELSLDGSIRRVPGVLAVALLARRAGIASILVPEGNASEAAAVRGITVFPARHLADVIDHARGNRPIIPRNIGTETRQIGAGVDLNCVRGQEAAKRGLEIAAAGSHNLLLKGPPGTGKTLLARTLPTILPPLSEDESVEATAIASVAGVLPEGAGLLTERPFRSPHHSASAAALVGGGNPPRPGEVTLAHRGVLFLDELPEFSKHCLDHLRQPLEDGSITISRASSSIRFPSRCMLVAAMNPCPCGFADDPGNRCTCAERARAQYARKLSGPLLDRFDLVISVPAIESDKLLGTDLPEGSESVRARVLAARIIQSERYKGTPYPANADLPASALEHFCPLDEDSKKLLRGALDAGHLSARGLSRIRKVARTIADLSGESILQMYHVAEALRFRGTVH